MGYASSEGKSFAIEFLRDQTAPIETFLDIGAGAGSWKEAIQPWFLESAWIAVEVWEPYVQQFCLWERYQMVISGDAREIPFPESDVIIMGDVLEHMSTEEAVAVWDKALASRRVASILSIPVINYPQGHVHGNPYQEHVRDDWTHEEVMDTFPGIVASTVGTTVGTYIA